MASRSPVGENALQMAADNIRTAEVVLPCAELDATLAFFTERLGFRIDAILPADDPDTAVLSGHGMRVRLARDAAGSAGVLRLACEDPAALSGDGGSLTAPNGTRIEVVSAEPALEIPANRPAFGICHMSEDAPWIVGRAGMRYRDLIPERQGGRYIASHIRIPEGGPVEDWVHFHEVRFQMIYCYTGWVRVVYEDQGPPFTLQAGDCVLQPPAIRHRVLDCSPGLEVIEVGCPAAHGTRTDHALTLPTNEVRPERTFQGQRFVHHVAADATWLPWHFDGFECRDAGIEAATGRLASVRVARPTGTRDAPAPWSNAASAELLLYFVLHGAVTLRTLDPAAEHALQPGDCVTVPGAMRHELAAWSRDLELLEVALPPTALP